jgi:hypothetical protein
VSFVEDVAIYMTSGFYKITFIQKNFGTVFHEIQRKSNFYCTYCLQLCAMCVSLDQGRTLHGPQVVYSSPSLIVQMVLRDLVWTSNC